MTEKERKIAAVPFNINLSFSFFSLFPTDQKSELSFGIITALPLF
jgi:hypothetical protein